MENDNAVKRTPLNNSSSYPSIQLFCVAKYVIYIIYDHLEAYKNQVNHKNVHITA